MPAICVCPHMGSPQALPQLKRALQGERRPCPHLLPPRSQQLTGAAQSRRPPLTPHPGDPCDAQNPGQENKPGRCRFCGGYFRAVCSDAVTVSPAQAHSTTRTPACPACPSPTPQIWGCPSSWAPSWCGDTGPLSPALGTPHSQSVELGPVSLLDLALFGGSKLLQHS